MKEVRKKKVLITGSAGFIGSSLKEVLVKNGYEVLGIGRSKNEDYSIDLFDPKIKNILLDFSPDIICHLANGSNIARANEEKEKEYRDTVLATKNFLDGVKALNLRPKIIFVSSQAVYGKPEYLPIDENHPLSPYTIYGQNKLESENLIVDSSFDYVIFRVSSLYGALQDYKKSGVISKFINKLKNNESPIVFNSLDITSDFIYINDLVEAIYKSIENEEFKNEILNTASGNPLSLKDLLNELYKYFPKAPKAEIINNDLYLGKDQKGLYLKTDKIQKKLNWKCKYSLANGLKEMLSTVVV